MHDLEIIRKIYKLKKNFFYFVYVIWVFRAIKYYIDLLPDIRVEEKKINFPYNPIFIKIPFYYEKIFDHIEL